MSLVLAPTCLTLGTVQCTLAKLDTYVATAAVSEIRRRRHRRRRGR